MLCAVAALGFATMLLAFGAAPAAAQSVVVVVNGKPITTYDIEQRGRLIRLSQHKTPSHQEVTEELVNEKLKLSEAQRWGIEVSTRDVDNAFANMAKTMGFNAQQLGQALNSQGVDPKSLKAKIRADLSWGNLVRGRFQSSLEIGERDIQAFLSNNKEDATQATVGYQYTLWPILFIVPQGSPASAFQLRQREADSLRSRFQGCDAGLRFARALRDVAVREPIIKGSAELPAPLRKVLNDLEVGHLTAPEITAQGVQVFALCGKKTAKSEAPGKHAAREEIFAKRYEAQSKRYLEQVRHRAMIEYKSNAR
jgi:peptidyl-prolyl cis-trans isomerase SurA